MKVLRLANLEQGDDRGALVMSVGRVMLPRGLLAQDARVRRVEFAAVADGGLDLLGGIRRSRQDSPSRETIIHHGQLLHNIRELP